MSGRLSRAPRPVAAGSMPTIDLMPAGEVARREGAVLIRKWGWATVAALAAVAVASAAAFSLQLAAAQRLATETAATQALLEELGSLSEVSTALSTKSELETFRTGAMASDISWTSLFLQMSALLPDGVAFSGFDLFPGGVPQTTDPVSEVGLVGDVSFVSPTSVEMAPIVQSFRALPGVIAVDSAELTSTDEEGALTYTYVISVEFDQTLYTEAFGAQREDR